MKASSESVAAIRDGGYDVLDYDDQIEVDQARRLVKGREQIRLRSLAPVLATVVFPRNGIDVLSLGADHGGVLGEHAGETIAVRFTHPIGPNEVTTITVNYRAEGPKGIAFHRDAVYTSFYTCSWMSCREDPADKATLRLSIAADENLTVVASGERDERESQASGVPARSVWHETIPCSSYLFGFALGHFKRYSELHGTIELEIYARVEDADDDLIRRMFSQSERAADFFVARSGQRFSHRRYGQVVVDGDASQEASSFSIIGRTELASLLSSPQRNWVIAHEMAHQFWGNSITCAQWTDFWLNEGLAVFMAAAFDEDRWGRRRCCWPCCVRPWATRRSGRRSRSIRGHMRAAS